MCNSCRLKVATWYPIQNHSSAQCLEHFVGLCTLKFLKGDGWNTACCKMLLFCARTIPIDCDNAELAFCEIQKKDTISAVWQLRIWTFTPVLMVMKTLKDEWYVVFSEVRSYILVDLLHVNGTPALQTLQWPLNILWCNIYGKQCFLFLSRGRWNNMAIHTQVKQQKCIV